MLSKKKIIQRYTKTKKKKNNTINERETANKKRKIEK